MAIFKCKMCGGDLEIFEGSNVAQCYYCDTKQTVPNADSEKKTNLFNRANRMRMAGEFEKASNLYETILTEFSNEAEAYWGLCLCDYGIEYVDDPATGHKIPTCHRASFERLQDNANFKAAVEHADYAAKAVYESEAARIDEIMSDVLSISRNESPYDIFICYKETDESGQRTIDSVMAQDLYEALTQKGYRVFFARITLEDKLGRQYEPYIFAALNSAKVMLVVGTSYDHLHAVWVQNEWSRFLKLMAKDKSKVLIPCYKDMDAYDLPEKFKMLQAQDLGKIGATQDLLRGIDKILRNASTSQSDEIADLIRKAIIHLQEKRWVSVQNTCKLIIEKDPECAIAYVLQLARVRRVTEIEDLPTCVDVLDDSSYYTKALKYADDELSKKLQEWCRRSHENCCLAKERLAPLRNRAAKLEGVLACGKNHIVALMPDGTVKACGENNQGQCDVEMWRDIVYVACGGDYTIGVREDGTVVACGNNDKGQCDVSGWTDIVKVAAYNHTIGVKKDGTVVACGDTGNDKCEVSGWTQVKSVCCGYRHTVAHLVDGSVVAIGSNGKKQCDLTDWKGIVSVSASNVHTVGVNPHGTIVNCGDNEEGQLNTKEWRDIVSVVCGTHHTYGLRADGTVVACGSNSNNRCTDSKNLTDVIALAPSYRNTIGIRSDGTIAACGNNTDGQLKQIQSWKLFENLDSLEQERIAARKERERQDKLSPPAPVNKPSAPKPAATPESSPMDEVEKRKNGPGLIFNVSAIGSNDFNNCWPTGDYEETFNYDEFNVVYFHLRVNGPALRHKSKIKTGMRIRNSKNVIVFDDEVYLDWQSNYDRIAKNWIIHGSDGTYVPVGVYHAQFWVEDSCVYEFDFKVTSDKQLDEEYEQLQMERIKLGLCRRCGGAFKKGLFGGVKCMRCGKAKDY